MDGKEQVPDHLRCRRTDGKRWRCPHLALQHVSFCDLHQVQARRRQYKLPVPDSLKLRHGRRGRLPSSTSTAADRSRIPKKRKVEVGGGEGEEEQKRRKVDEGYLVGLMRMMVWRRKTSNGEKEEEEEEEEERMKKTIPIEESRVRVQRRKMRIKNKDETLRRKEVTGIKSKGETLVTMKSTGIEIKDETLKRRETTEIKSKDETSISETTEINSNDETLTRDTWVLALTANETTVVVHRRTRKRKEYAKVKKEATVAPMPVEEVGTNQRSVSELLEITPEVSKGCSINVPDHLRCRRNDGKQWRCQRQAMENHCFCELHHIQQYRRQYKLGVPESLKLKRKPRGPNVAKPQVLDQIPKESMKTTEEEEEEVRRTENRVKRRKKIESLLVELMRMVLKRQMERRKKEEMKRKEESVEVMRKLPNGLMAISPVSNFGGSSNVGRHLDRKLGLDPSSFLRWCFRSKNVELPPSGTVQKFPYVKKASGLVKRWKRMCHHCRNSGMCQTIRCSSCRRVFFCKTCIKKWYSELSAEDVKEACPICRGNCCCAGCLPGGLEESNTILHSVTVR